MKRRLNHPISLLTTQDETLDSRFAADLEKRWRRAAPTLEELTINHIMTNLNSFPREVISTLPRSLHAMLYEQRNKLVSVGVREPVRHFICGRLASLSFSDFINCSQESLEEIVTMIESQAQGSLRTLDMKWFGVGPDISHTQKCRILASQPNIEKIRIEDQKILRLLPALAPQLKSLELELHSGIMFSDVKIIASLKELTRLVLSGQMNNGTPQQEDRHSVSYISEEEIMMFLENLPKLKELRTPCNGVHWGLLNYIEKYRQSRPLKLQCFETYSIDSAEISEIVKHLPDLVHLKLVNYQHYETLAALRRLGDVKLTKLEYVREVIIGEDPSENLEDDISHFFTHAGQRLESLSLTCNVPVDLSEIGRFCPRLCHIHLDGIIVPEDSKYDIEDQPFSKLEQFEINIDTMLPHATLVHVLTRPSLEVFKYEGENPISTLVFKRIFNRARTNEGVFSNLRSLEFIASPGINIAMILQLICLAPKLTYFRHDDVWERTPYETNAVRTIKKFLKRHGIRGKFFE